MPYLFTHKLSTVIRLLIFSVPHKFYRNYGDSVFQIGFVRIRVRSVPNEQVKGAGHEHNPKLMGRVWTQVLSKFNLAGPRPVRFYFRSEFAHWALRTRPVRAPLYLRFQTLLTIYKPFHCHRGGKSKSIIILVRRWNNSWKDVNYGSFYNSFASFNKQIYLPMFIG